MLKISPTNEGMYFNMEYFVNPQKLDTLIVEKDLEVKSRLYDFGLTKPLVGKICESVLHGRNLNSALQPKTAEGLLKYIFGVEGLREVFLDLDSENTSYEIFSKNNIEGVFDRQNGRKIMFQMVDQACGFNDPQPKSKIGEGKRDLIRESAQNFLFPEFEDEEKKLVAEQNALNQAECWYVIVSVDEKGVLCCELSHTKPVNEDDMLHFFERIKVFKYGEFEEGPNSWKNRPDDSDDTYEIKPVIRKK